MKKTYQTILGLAFLVGAAFLCYAQTQDQTPDKAVVPLSDPSKPAVVRASVLMGGITVKGYEGKEVIVEAKVRERFLSEHLETYNALGPVLVRATRDAARAAREARDLYSAYRSSGQKKEDEEKAKEEADKAAGMKKLTVVSTGLEVEENNNVVTIGTQAFRNSVDLTIQVPFASSLELSSINDGDILVENTSGEIEVKNTNGAITLRNISGNVVANTINGDLTAVLTKVTAGKPMSFSNMNGDVDVTLPADIKANVKMKTQQGDVYSDFDIVIKQAPQKVEESATSSKGKYHISFDKAIYGMINGGGAEFSFSSFNGDIYIRKKK